MEQELIQETEQRIYKQYKDLCQLLLTPASYDAEAVTTDHIQWYLTFLERALRRPYNRIAHFHTLLADPDGLMAARMYPLCYLSKQSLAEVAALYQRTERLAAGLYVTLPQAGKVLEEES